MKFGKKYLLILTIFLFSVSGLVSAANYCVRDGASGSNNGSDWTNAYTDLPSTLERGSTYYIADGNYNGYTFDDSPSATYITVKKATASDHGTGTGWQSSYGDGIAFFGNCNFSSTSYVIFDGQVEDGFTLIKEGEGGTVVTVSNSNHITVRNCDLDGNFATLSGGEPTSHTDGACHILHLGTVSYVTIENCKLHNVADDGMEIHGADNLSIVGNQVYNLYGCGTDGGCGDCYNGHSDGIEIFNVENSEFKENLVYDVRSTAAFISGNWTEDPNNDSSNVALINNIFYSPETGFSIYVDDLHNIELTHNVFWGVWQGSYGGLSMGTNVTDMDMYNNIILSINYSHMGATYDSDEHRGDYNLFGYDTEQYPLQTNDIVDSDPNFENIPDIYGSADREVVAEDFRLTSASSARDAGTNMGITVDFFGNSRPQGSGYDMGAHEYGAAPDTTAPSPDPMTWSTDPYATGTSSISMTATTATDSSGVEYYFDCTAGGGNDSGWQDSTTYQDTGLSASTQYTYRVKARDKSSNQNETAYSTTKSATTDSAGGGAYIDATFDSDADGFTYADITNGSYVDGSWDGSYGYSGGGIRVRVAPGPTGGATDGQYSDGFSLSSAGWVTITLRYRLEMGEGFESDEYGEAYLMIDSTRYGNGTGDSLVRIVGNGNGGGTDDSGWLSGEFNASLSSGSHTIKVGVYNNNSTYGDEWVNAYFDNVKVEDTNAPDTTAPSPDPMTWATDPYATGTTSISMTATTATDASGVEYYFDCTAGGGHDSGWQDSTTYTDTDLSELTQYTYQVKARDKSSNQNETAYSTTKSATTQDGTAPSPDPMTFSTDPYATGTTSISMTATTATDASGVEYYFDCTAGGGNDSGWQDSTTYQDTGLSASTQYTYRVQARDKSSNQNATGYSTSKSATTDSEGITLVSWWELDESSGTTASDSSGNNHDGTLSGASWAPTSGKFDGAVDIGDANSDRVQVPTTGMSASAGTISLWGRLEGTQSEMRYFFGHTSGSTPASWPDRIQIYLSDGDNQLDLGLGDTQTRATNIQTLSANTWYHIALTWDGTNYVVYVDGISKASGTYTGLSTLNSIADIGNDGNAGYRIEAFQGLLDDVRFYDAALSKYDIADLAGITIASDPSPADNATDVSTTADLSWSAGYYAADVNGHDVYFGTDYNSVADANHSSSEYKGVQDSNTYDPGTMSTNTTHYWAIDEVNDSNTWMGEVFSFTTILPDTTAPSPDPMTWATEPYATGATSISMTATTATDVSGVEYFFDCTTAGGHDSDWQDSATYEDTALSSETQYSYKVQARDKSANHNATAFSTTKSATTDFDPNLVSLWRLDESSGTTAADSSGNSHDGTRTGGSWAPTSGKIDGAVDIGDANSDRVQVPTTGMSVSAGTIALWSRIEGTQSDMRYLFGHTSGSTPASWPDRIQIYLSDGDNQLDLGLGDNHDKHTNIQTLSADTWYHIALTWDGSNYVVYVDGDNDANGTYSGLSTLNSIADIGNDGNAGYRIEAFQGLLDDVRFYDEVLSQSEVQDLAGE